jgi:hypothetical protein
MAEACGEGSTEMEPHARMWRVASEALLQAEARRTISHTYEDFALA